MAESLIPRLYQLEIVELAKKSNVVAYLDTGAGKTFIAVLLLRHRQEAAAAAHAAALASSSPPPPPWKAIFLAPQVALVEQQASVLARHLSARVCKLVGADIESWTGDAYISNWRRAINELDVLVATPQLLVDMLRHAVVPGLWIFDIIVFDEAHHCKGGHPYNRIMEYYKMPTTTLPSSSTSSSSFSFSKPRIFGMSAAPAGAGAAKFHLLPKSLALLESNMQSQVVTTVDRSAVDAVIPQPELEIEEYQSGAAMIEAIPNLKALQVGIEKALARLDVAVALEKLRFNASLQGTVSLSGASDATYCTFDPGAPKFKIFRLKDILRSVLHVLDQVGAYGAVQSTLHAFQWLAKGAPDARRYNFDQSSFGFNSGFGGDYGDYNNTDSYVETDIEYKLAEIRMKAAAEGVEWSEVEDLGQAAVLSTVEVLKSFIAAFSDVLVDQDVVCALGQLEAAYNTSKPAAIGGGGGGASGYNKNNNTSTSYSVSLGTAPIFIMQRIINLVTPEDLEQSLEFIHSATLTHFSAPGAARACYLLTFHFPLVSPKTVKLVKILQRYSPQMSSSNSNIFNYWSGIVFAQQRTTVLALASLLARLPPKPAYSWLKISPFMAQGAALGGLTFMPDEQKAILDSFRAGKLNLLVSTSVAEEGIDVKSCQLVIRFDPAPTAQAFHQSRGRARAAGSQLIALVEHGNAKEHAAVHEMAAYQHKMRGAALQNVADLAHQAENFLLDGADADDADQDDIVENALSNITESNREYIVAATGAKIDLHSAGSVLQHYISQLPADEFMLLRPAWRLDYLSSLSSGGGAADRGPRTTFGPPPPSSTTSTTASGSFQVRATVRLPSSSPIQMATGQLAATKRIAKASAALEACRELHRLGALNDHLLPAGVATDDAEEEEEVLEEMVTGQGKRRRAGTIFAACHIKNVPPAALSTPLPRGVQAPMQSITLYGYGWKQQQGAVRVDSWFPLVLLLPKLTDLSCCSAGGSESSGLGSKRSKAGSWSDAVPLGEFQFGNEQLKLVLQCSQFLKTASGPWHSLSIASSSAGDDGDAPAPTYALAPLHVPTSNSLSYSIVSPKNSSKRGNSTSSPQLEIDWAKLQRIVWLQDTSRTSELSVLDIMRHQKDNSTSMLEDSVLITKYNRMMYEFLNVSTTMTLSSAFPQDRPSTTTTGSGIDTSKRVYNNTNNASGGGVLLGEDAKFSDFYAHRWKQTSLDPAQPLLEAARKGSNTMMARRQNQSQRIRSSDKEEGEITEEVEEEEIKTVFLVPELCTLHPIPLSLWPALAAVPRLLWDIEGGLRAFELISEIKNAGFPAELCPPVHLVKQAITAPSASIDSLEQGNYETLEALGDGLLKFAASTQLFLNNPLWHEGQLASTKDTMVSNRKLIKVALKLGLERRVRLSGWRVKERKNRKSNEGDKVLENNNGGDVEMQEQEEGELGSAGDPPPLDAAAEEGCEEKDDDDDDDDDDDEEEEVQSTQRNGKLLADAMEALVGAFYVGGGFKSGLAFCRHVELADCPLDKLTQYISSNTTTAAAGNNKGNPATAPPNQQQQKKNNNAFPSYFSVVPSSITLHSLDIDQVQDALGGYTFKNPALAQEALTHGSVLGQRCYQRLEFLGDAILDLVLLKTAYQAYNNEISPAQLHDVRSITLNAERLALAAVRANFHTHICYHSAALFHQIDAFVVEAEAAVSSISTTCSWDEIMVRYAFGLDRICAPKVLSDITEALIGAVWLDAQGDWGIAAAVIKYLLSPLPWIDDVAARKCIPPHPVRRIHELAAQLGVKAEFQVVKDGSSNSSVNTMAVRVMFGDQCLGQGPPSGGNRSAASRLAAQAVLATRTEKEILSLFQKKK